MKFLQTSAVSVLNNADSLQVTGVSFYEGWNFNSGNYLFTTDTK